jgi:hypothetical protein
MIAKLFNSFNSEKKSPLLAFCFVKQRKKFNFAPKIRWRALAEGEPATSFSNWRKGWDSNPRGDFSPRRLQRRALDHYATLP